MLFYVFLMMGHPITRKKHEDKNLSYSHAFFLCFVRAQKGRFLSANGAG
jgi:hypothetical protein